MKKPKLALLSMIVFVTVFSLTVIFNIELPLYAKNGSISRSGNVTSTNSYAMVEEANTREDSRITGGADAANRSSSKVTPTTAPTQALTAADTIIQTAEITPTPAPTAIPTATPTPTVTPTPKAESQYSDIGISIAKDYVNIREKASTDSSVLGKLYKGSAVEIIKTKGDWYSVESGSVKGYVKAEFIKTGIPDDELIEKYGTLSISVDVDGLNVRKKPSTESKKVTVIYKDEIYPVLETKDDWIKIEISDDNATGYVKKEFSELLVDFKEAVSKEEEQKLLQLEAEERAKKETEIQYEDGVSYSSQDLKLLACLIHAEAGTQSYECKLAVANIVLNRVASSKYSDTIKRVIYQSGQFSVAASGSLQKQLDKYNSYSTQSQLLSIKAAKDALKGANNIGSRLYFHSYKAAVSKGYDSKSTSVKINGLLFW